MITTTEDQASEAASRARAEEWMEEQMRQQAEGVEVDESSEDKSDGATEDKQESTQYASGDEGAVETLPDDKNDAKPVVDDDSSAPGASEEKGGEGESEKEEPAAATPVEEEDEVIKAIDSVNLRDTAHPKTKKALGKVKEIAKIERKARLEAEKVAKAREEELEKAKSLKLLDEPTEKELQELRSFRRTVDIEHDPEFNKKFVEGEKAIGEQMVTVLKRYNMPQSTLEFIEKAGGVIKFSGSDRLMPAGLVDTAGNKIATHKDGTPYTYEEFFDKDIKGKLAPRDRQIIEALGVKAINLELERDDELSKAKANAEHIFIEREEKAAEHRTKWQAEFKEEAERIVNAMGDVAKEKEVPANATLEEKKRIDAANQRVQRARGLAQRYATDWTSKTVADLVVTKAYYETVIKDQMDDDKKTIERLTKELKDEQEKNNRFKNAGKVSKATTAATSKEPADQGPYDPEEDMMKRQEEYLKTHQR